MTTIKPEFAPEDQVSDAELSQSNAFLFQKKPLWPLTKESDLLMAHVSRGVDLGRFTSMAFVFIHFKRGGATFFDDLQTILPVVWDDPNKFRIEVLKFFSTYDHAACDEAMELWMRAYNLKRRTEVVAASQSAQIRRPAKKKPRTHVT